MLYSGYFASMDEAETYLAHHGFVPFTNTAGCWQHTATGKCAIITVISEFRTLVEFT